MDSTGYILILIELLNENIGILLSEIKNQCKRLIVGIPDDEVRMRILGPGEYEDTEVIKKRLLESKYIDEVIVVDKTHTLYENMAEILEYDVVFDGKKYNIPAITKLEEFAKAFGKENEILNKIHEINYDLIDKFNEVCEKVGAEYYLFFGSALGAIRHQAIIPWDNDVDTILKREDGDKIRKNKAIFDGNFFYINSDIMGEKRYFDSVDRIGYKKAYISHNPEREKFYGNNMNSIHLDLFLLDKTYDNFWGKLQRYELAVLYGLMNAYRHESFFADYPKWMRKANDILKIVGKIFPLSWLRKRADKVARRFDKDDNAPYYFLSNDVFQKLFQLYPVSVFSKPIKVPFGKTEAYISPECDTICRTIFGNYEELPPAHMRIPHCGREYMTADSYVFEEPDRVRIL